MNIKQSSALGLLELKVISCTLYSFCLLLLVYSISCPGGVGDRGTLNFVCYIGWVPASSLYQKKYIYIRYIIRSSKKKIKISKNKNKKYPVYQPYPKTYRKKTEKRRHTFIKYSPWYLFIKVWFSVAFSATVRASDSMAATL